MSNQITITGGAKVRNLEGVITGTVGVLSSLPINTANGIPQLDSSGKILVSQLPNSVMEYKGTWNVTTNTPYLVNGVGNAGDVYIVTGAATGGTTHDFGAGAILFYNGDQAIYDGSAWQRASGSSGTVTSVAISESSAALNITGSPITTSGTINIGFAGTSAQYVAGDGSLVTFPSTVSQAQTLITEVYNETGATLTKGTVVYINGGHGNLPTITKALATSDSTSAQTYGVVQSDITNMNNGYVVVIGLLGDLDTQAYTNGTILYLSSTTAGAWTSTKQYAPAHLVYVGIVVRSHPTQGVVEIKVQNGYEMDELHNVSAQSPSNGNILQYVSSTNLWTSVAGTTTNIAEGTNLYFTDARARAAISLTTSGTSGASTYNSTTGVLNIPQYQAALTNPVTGTGTSGTVAFWNGTTTQTYDSSFIYDSSTKRLGVNTTVPNATIGANSTIDSGYALMLKSGASNYNGIAFGLSSTYGNSFETQKTGTAAAMNLTFTNQTGYISLTEAGSLGLNILTPTASPSGVGSLGIDINGGSSAAGLGFHNTASGTGNTNGAYLYLTNSLGFVLRNLEGGITLSGGSTAGDISLQTQGTENFRINYSDGSIYQSKVANAMLKSVSGVITAAVAGTDYQPAGTYVTSITGTSPISSTGSTSVAISIAQATTTTSGYLSSTDWNTFNNKQGAITLTTSGGSGAATLIGNTLNIPNYTLALAGYVPTSRTLTINGTTYDLSADRSWTISAGISGTLSSGYVPVANGPSSLTDSAISDNGTYIQLYRLTNVFYNDNSYGGLTIKNSNTGSSALAGISIQNTSATTVAQMNYISTTYANTTLRDTFFFNTVASQKIGFGTNSGGGATRADIYFTVNPAFTLSSTNPNQIQILGSTRNVAINYSGTDYGEGFQVNGTMRTSSTLGVGGSVASGYNLHVYGTGTILGIETTASSNVFLRMLQAGTVVSSLYYLNSDSTLRLVNNNGGIRLSVLGADPALTIATSTGAATFSSSVANGGQMWVNGITTSSNGALNVAAPSAAYYNGLVVSTSSYTPSSSGTIVRIGHSANSGDATGIIDVQKGGGILNGNLSLMPFGGNVGIGTSSPLVISGYTILSLNNATNGGMIDFQTNGTSAGLIYSYSNSLNIGSSGTAPIIFLTASGNERGRFTSGGSFKATTNGTYLDANASYHELRQSNTNSSLAAFTHTAASPYGLYLAFTGAAPNNTTNYFYAATDTVNDKAIIYSNGTYGSRTGTYGSIISDIKYKQDITDANSQWDDIKKLRVVNFKYKEDVELEGENALRQIGFIAQEVEKVSPNLVYEAGKKDSDETWKSVKTSIIEIKAIKALQEAMLRIEELEDRLNKLEKK